MSSARQQILSAVAKALPGKKPDATALAEEARLSIGDLDAVRPALPLPDLTECFLQRVEGSQGRCHGRPRRLGIGAAGRCRAAFGGEKAACADGIATVFKSDLIGLVGRRDRLRWRDRRRDRCRVRALGDRRKRNSCDAFRQRCTGLAEFPPGSAYRGGPCLFHRRSS